MRRIGLKKCGEKLDKVQSAEVVKGPEGIIEYGEVSGSIGREEYPAADDLSAYGEDPWDG